MRLKPIILLVPSHVFCCHNLLNKDPYLNITTKSCKGLCCVLFNKPHQGISPFHRSRSVAKEGDIIKNLQRLRLDKNAENLLFGMQAPASIAFKRSLGVITSFRPPEKYWLHSGKCQEFFGCGGAISCVNFERFTFPIMLPHPPRL